MKHRLTRKEAAPPNLAAKALSNALFRPKVEKNPNAYNRKQKFKKGSLDDVQLPFSLEEAAPAQAEAGDQGKTGGEG